VKPMVFICLLHLLAIAVLAKDQFINHGVGAPVAESRGVAMAQDSNGTRIVLCLSLDQSARGWMLVTDLSTKETTQYYYPEGVPNSPPYASLLSNNGRFYTFAGNVLLEFDIDRREWLFHGVPLASASCYTGASIADGPDGLIYAGSYPNCHLVSFNPETKAMADLGQLDAGEHYVHCLVADETGWVYAGIGTARANVVAFNPNTKECVQVAAEEDRVTGSGSVSLGTDGKVYGRAGKSWYRMFGGKAEKIEGKEVVGAQPTGGIDWSQTRGAFPDGSRVKAYNLPERYMEIESKDGEVERVTFDYSSGGASLTSVAAGPNGQIYASSCHPMHFVAYDPQTDTLEDRGPLARVGGGNFCSMAAQGSFLYGAAYCGGFFYEYDTRKPWNNETGDEPNPRLAAQYKDDITRPRACIAHPDGRHVLMGGFADYGLCGGGLCIYDQQSQQAALITHEDLVPYHSTIAMDVLPGGDIIGGTSISAPGGGHTKGTAGVIYILDWETKKVTFKTVPAPGAGEIISLRVGTDGYVYGMASGTQFFVFDPAERKIVHRENLSAYGGAPRHGLLLSEEGDMYGIFGNCIVRFKPGEFGHEKLAEVPAGISYGGAIVDGRIYYASGATVYSFGYR